jgi:hypothetical protein
MPLDLAIATLVLTLNVQSGNPALLMRPTSLNIGHVCRWEARCMRKQEQAMANALRHVRKYQQPHWKIARCNRNASRGRSRVDWIGFNNCIRNPAMQPLPRRTRR